jgi:hypothetical protein
MSWIKRTSFGDHVKDMSFEELVEQYGEEKGQQVADHFGIKKAKRKTKKAEPKEDAGEE